MKLPPDSRDQRPSPAAIEVLRRLRWPVERRLGVHTAGDQRSRLRGPGIEYSDVREYQDGEDARLIDWNLTARSDRPFVRESQPDRGMDIWLIVDSSRSLDWGTALGLKRHTAAELVDLLAVLLSRHGTRVGAMVFDTRLRHVLALTAGRQGRMRLVARVEAAGSNHGDAGVTDLADALRRAGRLISRPSLVIVVSDFIVPGGWQRPLKAMSMRHEVVAARVSDPREANLPQIGVVTLEDPETGAQLEVDTTSARLRARYREAAAAQHAGIINDLRAARAELMEISTGSAVLPQLVHFLSSRQARRGRAVRRRGA
jgi:uncharacterized protein (DUF58 family)